MSLISLKDVSGYIGCSEAKFATITNKWPEMLRGDKLKADQLSHFLYRAGWVIITNMGGRHSRLVPRYRIASFTFHHALVFSQSSGIARPLSRKEAIAHERNNRIDYRPL